MSEGGQLWQLCSYDKQLICKLILNVIYFNLFEDYLFQYFWSSKNWGVWNLTAEE